MVSASPLFWLRFLCSLSTRILCVPLEHHLRFFQAGESNLTERLLKGESWRKQVRYDVSWESRFAADEAFIMLIRLLGRMSVQFWLI